MWCDMVWGDVMWCGDNISNFALPIYWILNAHEQNKNLFNDISYHNQTICSKFHELALLYYEEVSYSSIRYHE